VWFCGWIIVVVGCVVCVLVFDVGDVEFVGLLYLILLSCQFVFVLCVLCVGCLLVFVLCVDLSGLSLASVQVYDMSTCFYCV